MSQPFRSLILILIVAIVTTLSVGVLGSKESNWTPLELPVAEAVSGVEMFGACLTGDNFVWCLDRSCSMGWGGLIGEMRLEVTEALAQLSPSNQFSVFAFSSSTVSLSGTLLDATPDNVDIATNWVNTLVASGSTCLINAAVSAIGVANQSSSSSVILVGDGTEFCSTTAATIDEVIDAILAANPGQVPVHTFYLNTDAAGIALYQAIADATGGTFVDTNQPLDLFRRGDVSQDGIVDVTDPIFLLSAGFIPGSPQPECSDAADADDNGEVDVLVDSIYLLQSLFVPGSPAPPFPANSCGTDPTPDGLICSGVCI